MQIPLQIAFHGLDHSAAVEDRIREKVSKLEQFSNRITSCRVVVEMHHKNTANTHKRGEPFRVSIHVSVPGDELVAHSSPKDPKAHEDIGIALRDTFQSMERQVRDYMERKRDEAKASPAVAIG
ncbi:MAG: HPF/RaiA family ribosome-associated protein [Rhodospirillaceae bacterium]